MVVGEDGSLPLPWLQAPIAEVLARSRGHALLVQAAPGIGALEFALSLAQSRLCESPAAAGLACGHCAACRLVHSHSHPDLFVLLPEDLRRLHGWLISVDKPEGDDKKKPSRQIRIDDVRVLLDWVVKTSARGRGKMVVIHPADVMNHHAASALLKTIEEPPAGTRLVLTCADAQDLLPTIRSRCQQTHLPAPASALALQWLAGQGVARPEVLLAATGGRPLQALAWSREGLDAAAWDALPQRIAQGQLAALAGWPLPRALEALAKLCHDAMAQTVGGAPRYFNASVLPRPPAMDRLQSWATDLQRLARAVDHPWHEALSAEALVARAHAAFRATGPRRGAGRPDTLPA